MNYEETLRYLYEQLPFFQRQGAPALKKFDLSKTRKICDLLDNPQNQYKTIHVAGTNGKGSTSHFLAAILQSAGYRTGLYTSPHLKSFTERIRVNGEEITQDYVVSFVERMKGQVTGIAPSFFELTMGMAFDYFANQAVDIAVIETGMGGRLDSTNVIIPELSVITNIGYDHQEFLGETLPEIAGEKAGIIKPGVPVVISETQPEVASVFEEMATRQQSPLHWAGQVYEAKATQPGVYNIFHNHKLWLEEVASGLVGFYQHRNIPGVCQAWEILNNQGFDISTEALREGIQQVVPLTNIKGRWQVLNQQPLTICDVAHNAEGIRYIVNQLQNTPHQKLWIVYGTVKDKRLAPVLEVLPRSAYYFFTEADLPRAMEANSIAKAAMDYNLHGEVVPGVAEAVDAARRAANKEDIIYIGGSTFIVAEIDIL